METRAFYLMALLLLSPALAKGAAFVEHALPAGEVPKYIRIDINGYNIRESTDFRTKRTDNIEAKSTKGDIYAVVSAIQMENGLAVNIIYNGKLRWVYVPNWRRQDFQFCESEACATADVQQVLNILSTQKIGQKEMTQCSLELNAEGTLVRSEAPRDLADIEHIPIPKARPVQEAEANDAELQARKPVVKKRKPADVAPDQEEVANTPAGPLAMTPMWEREKPGIGRRWTKLLNASLDKFGQNLLSRRSLSDAAAWCPNYGKLNAAQRREFWIHAIVGMNKAESGFSTMAVFDEATHGHPSRGGPKSTYSMGMGQLGYVATSAGIYSDYCKFNYKRDKRKSITDPTLTIYDPKLQLECQVGMLNHWVKKDGGLGFKASGSRKNRWRGGARYWSTYRSNNHNTKRVKAYLKKFKPCWR